MLAQVAATVGDDGFPSGGVKDASFVSSPPGMPAHQAAHAPVQHHYGTRAKTVEAAAVQQLVGETSAIVLPALFTAGPHLTAADLQFGTLLLLCTSGF